MTLTRLIHVGTGEWKADGEEIFVAAQHISYMRARGLDHTVIHLSCGAELHVQHSMADIAENRLREFFNLYGGSCS